MTKLFNRIQMSEEWGQKWGSWEFFTVGKKCLVSFYFSDKTQQDDYVLDEGMCLGFFFFRHDLFSANLSFGFYDFAVNVWTDTFDCCEMGTLDGLAQ